MSDKTIEPQGWAAWAAWTDTSDALSRLEKTADEGGNWHVEFVAVVTMLRLIGHAIKNTDAKRDPEIRRRLDARWSAFKEKADIRWIVDTRNALLKEYAIDVSVSPVWVGEYGKGEQRMAIMHDRKTGEYLPRRLLRVWQLWGDLLAAVAHDLEPKASTKNHVAPGVAPAPES